MTGYTRKDTTNNISDGSIINADDLDNEFDGVQSAFNASTGHTHDGTAAEGAPVTKIGPVQDVIASTVALYPKTTNTVDLGTASLKYKDAFLAGSASVGGALAVTGAATLTNLSYTGTLTGGTGVVNLGSGQLVKDAAGNVGIGTTPLAWDSASKVLEMPSGSLFSYNTNQMLMAVNSYYNGANWVYNRSAVATYYQQTLGQHQWHNAPSGTAGNPITFTQAMTLDASGNLGIGTSSPGYKLDVATSGTTVIRSYAGAGNQAYVSVAGNDGVVGASSFDIIQDGSSSAFIYNRANTYMAFGTNNTERMRLDASGNLGLGVVPSAWSGVSGVFEIKGNSYIYSTSGVMSLGANAYFNGTNWIYKTTQAVTRYEQVLGQHQWSNAPSGTAGNAISFTQAMTLDASGNLGVGTTAPATYGSFAVKTANGLVAVAPAGSIGAEVRFYNTSGTQTAKITNNGGANELLQIDASAATGAILLNTNGSERMRLDASGNLGLGVTPSAWSAAKAFQMPNGVFLSANSGTTTPFANLGANTYFNGTSWIYSGSFASTRYAQLSGEHQWFTALSGTAGNAITFSQAMTLDASGKLSLGTTNAYQLLTLNGSIHMARGALINFSDTSALNNLISADTSNNLLFWTGAAEKMRLDASGNLLPGADNTQTLGSNSLRWRLDNPTVTNYTETPFTANTGTAITIALTNGTVQILTLTGSPTITMPAAVAGKSFIIMLKTGTGSFTVTWTTVKWPAGTAPTITSIASRQDVFSFFSDGTNWYGSTLGQNYTP